jgi:hypothetical protein
MSCVSKVVTICLTGLFALGTTAGCKVSPCDTPAGVDGGKPVTKGNCIELEPTEQYTGNVRTGTQAWSSGKNVIVTNGNGDLKIFSDGAAGEVRVDGTPFTRDGSSTAEMNDAYARLAARPDPTVGTDASGNITINAPGSGFDGYRLNVHLPSSGFDGATSATTDNGPIEYHATPATSGNSLVTKNGDINAFIGAGAKIMATGKTELGIVVFRGAWTSPAVSADQLTGSAQLGDGSGSLNATTGLGDVVFELQ